MSNFMFHIMLPLSFTPFLKYIKHGNIHINSLCNKLYLKHIFFNLIKKMSCYIINLINISELLSTIF